jgi:hypothetical protein
MNGIDRPLRVSEVFAESMRLYGERIWAALGLGLIEAASFAIARLVPAAVGVAILALVFAGVFGAASRIVAGDSFAEAWAQVGLRIPVLLALAFVVAAPFAVAVGYLVLTVVAVLWLALTGFAVPVAMLERDPEARGWFGRIGYALRRSVMLSRSGYAHAAGAVGALVLVYLVVGVLLAGLLVGFADTGGAAAAVLVQLVLAPFFFFGLSVLYLDQKARLALTPPGQASTVS